MYVGGSLTTFFSKEAQEATRNAARELTRAAGNRLHEVVKMNTPVDSGRLRESWSERGPEPWGAAGANGFRVTVSTDVSYAPFVEHGTGLWGPKHAPYEIHPRSPGGVLRFVSHGRVVFAKHVLHPGSPGNFMMAIGLSMLDADLWVSGQQRVLEEWKRAVEGQAHG